jgi:hypothetical protein
MLRGTGDIRQLFRELTLSSNVTAWVKVVANLGRSIAAGVVPRGLASNQAFQMLWAGSGQQVGVTGR